ncbi:tyrosyl-DNA phosphodiesterase glaikit isoform X1 [Rhodnius prolixus]
MNVSDLRMDCHLGEKCYRKKKQHFYERRHRHLEKLLEEYQDLNIPTTFIAKLSHQTLREQLKFLQEIRSDCTTVEDSLQNIGKSSPVSLSPNKKLTGSPMSSSKNNDKSSSNEQICSYGEKCYRKNPKHFETFSHPHLNDLIKIMGDKEISIPPDHKTEISLETLKLQLSFLRRNEVSEDSEDHIQPSSSSSRSSRCKHPEEASCKVYATSKNEAQAQGYRVVVLDRVKNPILNKLMAAAPYNFFLTTISDSPQTHNEMLSLTFAELVDPNLGQLESSLQINFMVQFGWLLAQYHIMGHRNKPMTLLYGDVDMELDRFKHFLTPVKVKPPSSFGSHHSKMMVFSYTDDSIRIVVCTANLVESDWDNRTQGLWISPRCSVLPKKSDTMAGDSPTNFKRDLIKYLSAYKLPELVPWVKKLQNVDMSAVRVFFISSVPGTHHSPAGHLKHDFGHPSLAKLLNEHIDISDNNSYPVIAQCSSIGSLGPKPESWLLSDMLSTFTSGKRHGVYSKPSFRFIYPSFENISSSYDGLLGGGCLPYSRKTHQRQEWVTSFMCQWISDHRHRTRAPPHIKTYCRVSPDCSKLSYFVLTSANMSKAAWGVLSKSGSLNILSYEAGVLFLPQFMIDRDYFPLTEELADENAPVFPMPYDLPPTSFAYSDIPWFIENIM